MLTFDRLWNVFLENKIKIKRSKKTVTIFILIILGFVFLVDQLHMVYYVQNSKTTTLVFNSTLNKTVSVVQTITVCVQPNSQVVLAQDMVFVIMRIALPFAIMFVCDVILVIHIRKSRKRIIHGRKEKKEHNFTKAVTIMNGSFLACNIGVVVYYIIVYYLRFSGTSFSIVASYINSLFGTCAILLSYIFTLSQFLIDMIFNKIFRKEIIVTFMILTGRRNQVEDTRGNTIHSRGHTRTH